MKKITMILAGVAVLFATSCTKNLNREPVYDVTSASVYKDFSKYKMILAKCYAGLSVTGQNAGDGNADVGGVDVGYLRGYWQMQELTTDEAVIAWTDEYLVPLHEMNWTADNNLIGAMYSRIFFQVALCNEFIRQTTDEKLTANGITGDNATEARKFRTEVRFLRALAYYHALDLYGNVPFVTEKDPIGKFFPKQISRKDLFAYIEAELKDIENTLTDARGNEYARADKGAAWTLLAKLYLNAEVYTGTQRYTDVITYCNKVIGAGYTLEPTFANLFLADNHLRRNEIIFPIAYDGTNMRTYNGTTYLVHAPVGDNMNVADFGIDAGWLGLRTTSRIVNLFTTLNDKRAMFFGAGRNLEINTITRYKDGYPITKWKNVTSEGKPGSDKVFVDTDYPLFRYAEVLLMYAEAVVRGGAGGSTTAAVGYINQLRTRAYAGSTAGNITPDRLTTNFIINERGREMMWEGQRRTDLIRFGMFTGSNYLWPWKGNVKEGVGVEDHRSLFPIPQTDLIANPNLVQNTGY